MTQNGATLSKKRDDKQTTLLPYLATLLALLEVCSKDYILTISYFQSLYCHYQLFSEPKEANTKANKIAQDFLIICRINICLSMSFFVSVHINHSNDTIKFNYEF